MLSRCCSSGSSSCHVSVSMWLALDRVRDMWFGPLCVMLLQSLFSHHVWVHASTQAQVSHCALPLLVRSYIPCLLHLSCLFSLCLCLCPPLTTLYTNLFILRFCHHLYYLYDPRVPPHNLTLVNPASAQRVQPLIVLKAITSLLLSLPSTLSLCCLKVIMMGSDKSKTCVWCVWQVNFSFISKIREPNLK